MDNIICIAGPTASGKTSLAVALAKELGGEVVSCDSMQIRNLEGFYGRRCPRVRRRARSEGQDRFLRSVILHTLVYKVGQQAAQRMRPR